VIYPRTTVLHDAEYVVYLFFKDITKLVAVKNQILRHRFIYRVFGSGSMYPPYALFHKVFHKATKGFNNGLDIGLLRTSDTRMAGYFMEMHRDLRLKSALQEMVTSDGYIANTKIAKSIPVRLARTKWSGSVCSFS
jgi:hypothetical protein